MKLCPVLLNSEDNKKYLLVAGKILTPQEALEREIYFGYIDVAPLPEKAPISQMLVKYTIPTLSFTGEMESMTIVKIDEVGEIPDDVLAKAKEAASEQESYITATLGVYTTGGTNE